MINCWLKWMKLKVLFEYYKIFDFQKNINQIVNYELGAVNMLRIIPNYITHIELYI